LILGFVGKKKVSRIVRATKEGLLFLF